MVYMQKFGYVAIEYEVCISIDGGVTYITRGTASKYNHKHEGAIWSCSYDLEAGATSSNTYRT